MAPLGRKIYVDDLIKWHISEFSILLQSGDMISFGKDGGLEHYGIIVQRDPVPCQTFCKELGKKVPCSPDSSFQSLYSGDKDFLSIAHTRYLVHLNGKGPGSSNFCSSEGENIGYVTCTLLCDYILKKENGVRKHDYVRVFKSGGSPMYNNDEIQARAVANINNHLGYNAIDGNCEHFARWCYQGLWCCNQKNEVRNKVIGAGFGVTAAGGFLSLLYPPLGLAIFVGGAAGTMWAANA